MWRNSELMLVGVLDAMDAPEAVDAENDDVDEDATEASNCIDEDVACASVAANYGELVNFVEGAVNRGKNDWIEDLGVLWEANWVEALDKASTAVAEGAKEEKMGKFASNFVRKAKKRGETSGFGVGNSTVMVRERPD